MAGLIRRRPLHGNLKRLTLKKNDSFPPLGLLFALACTLIWIVFLGWGLIRLLNL
jgi:hypothetical protein